MSPRPFIPAVLPFPAVARHLLPVVVFVFATLSAHAQDEAALSGDHGVDAAREDRPEAILPHTGAGEDDRVTADHADHGAGDDLDDAARVDKADGRNDSLETSGAFEASDSTAPDLHPPAGNAGVVNLNARVIRGSRAAVIKRQAYNVSALDVTKVKERNVTVTEVLNQSSGVVVREDGGMGSGTTVSLNGMSGNQVRTFIDGLPIDVFGPAMSLGNLPPNTIDVIEVYKGVVPIHLGADALGGAVNILTNQRYTPYLDATYAYSSFNTHRGTLAGQWVSDSARAFVKTLGFYNHSDNDYRVTVRPRNSDGTYRAAERLRRFHDSYTAWSGGVETGVYDRAWADLLSVSYAYGWSHDDVQHAKSLDRVYGRVFTEWDSHTLGGKYRKRGLLVDGLSLTAYAAYNDGYYRSVDTAARIYDWYGNYVPNVVPDKGESDWRKIYYTWNSDAVAANVNLAYAFGDGSEASLNYALTRYAVVTQNRLDEFAYVHDQPSLIRNHTYAAAYKRSLTDFWSATAFAKLYRTHPLLRDYDYWESAEGVRKTDRAYPGYGLATTVFATPSLQAKLSYEHAVRMPEAEEIFGDGVLQEINIDLKPERSHNLNLGAVYAQSVSDYRFFAEGNAYYRGITGLIREDFQGGPTSRFVNLSNAVIMGVEGEVAVDYRRLLEARANLTYDHAINTTRMQNGLASVVYLDRIPNRPYLYGNTQFTAHWPDAMGLPGKFSLSLDSRWVHAYYLFWESQGAADTKFSIPGQLSHNASLVYSAPVDRYSLAFECRNLTDEDLYDNFRQQKPGRAFSAKIRFSL